MNRCYGVLYELNDTEDTFHFASKSSIVFVGIRKGAYDNSVISLTELVSASLIRVFVLSGKEEIRNFSLFT